MMRALKFFENTIARKRSFSWTTSSPRTAARRKTDLKHLALKAYRTKLQDIRDHLVLRRFLGENNHSQVK